MDCYRLDLASSAAAFQHRCGTRLVVDDDVEHLRPLVTCRAHDGDGRGLADDRDLQADDPGDVLAREQCVLQFQVGAGQTVLTVTDADSHLRRILSAPPPPALGLEKQGVLSRI